MQARWSSRFGFIMATTGASVGLGNIWKFPYMAGANGGGAFVSVYLIAVLCLAIPVLLTEIMLGKLGQGNAVSSIERLSVQHKLNPNWALVGWWGAFSLVLILSFYSVVAGWAIAYLYKTLNSELIHLSPEGIQLHWSNFLAEPWGLLLWHSLFMALTMFVVSQGLKRGVERASKILMPALFILLICLSIYSSQVGDFKGAYHFLLHFDWSGLTAPIIISALGHAFFTLATGAGCMLVYGAYLPENAPFIQSSFIAALLDILVAFAAGFAIFPLIFHYQLAPAGGPGLMFTVLPIAFNKMAWGRLVGVAFFSLLWFAAWSSTLSMAEPLVALLCERYQWGRVKAASAVGLLAWGLGIGSLLSFNQWQNYTWLDRNFFNLIADGVTHIMLPMGALSFSVFLTQALPQAYVIQAWQASRWSFRLWYHSVRWCVPIGIVTIWCLSI